jgi:hypothetical protein
MAQQGYVELERCRRSLLYYLERYCWTVNERDRHNPVQRLLHGDYSIDPMSLQLMRDLDGREDDFLRLLAAVWEQEPLLAVPKSRQMRVSHWAVHIHGWIGQFWPGQKVAVQSKNFEDADALLERLHQAWTAARRLHPNVPWPPYTRKVGRIICANGSTIMAIAQGAEKMRSYTFSAILSDEMGFQDKAEEAYTAALPTIEGGGKYTAISSANPGFFKALCFDAIRSAE